MFIPGSIEPADLDLAMRGSLAGSLSHVYSVAGAHLDISGQAAAAALDSIRAHRVRPGIFGRYYKLVLAIQRDDLKEAQDCFREIIVLANCEPAFSVSPFTAAALGDEMDIYISLIDSDPGGPRWLASPGVDQWAAFDDRVDEALKIIEFADEPLANELRGLTIEIVGALPVYGQDAPPFGGASSFMLWGLLLFNIDRYSTASKLVDGLVHEAAHQLLFAHSIDGPLVTNAIEERYPSPLRSDPRPMDGIFHATFVTARLHYMNQKLRDATTDQFAPIDPKMLDEKLCALRDLYFGGLQTVQKFGKLTSTGQQIIQESLDYMQAT